MTANVVVKFDGIDGCGKSTLIKAVSDWYSRRARVSVVKEFGSEQDIQLTNLRGKSVSQFLSSIILDPDYAFDDIERELLWAVISRRTNRLVIPSQIESNDLVLVDRSNLGNLAYGSAFDEFLFPIFIRYVGQLERADIIFLIDTPLEECQRRLALRNKLDLIESKGERFFSVVQDAYRQLSKNDPRVVVLDGSETIDQLRDIVTKKIDAIWTPHVARNADGSV